MLKYSHYHLYSFKLMIRIITLIMYIILYNNLLFHQTFFFIIPDIHYLHLNCTLMPLHHSQTYHYIFFIPDPSFLMFQINLVFYYYKFMSLIYLLSLFFYLIYQFIQISFFYDYQNSLIIVFIFYRLILFIHLHLINFIL